MFIQFGDTGLSPMLIGRKFPPNMNVDFTDIDTLDSRITFTRASSKTYFNSSGTLATAATNEAPREYDPVTLACRGRSFWEARTNLLLNSLIDGTNLSTQSITTTAAARTLSFYGTGQIVLSGTHSATVVGTGAFPTRTTYTYTPTAGTLTLTVSGTVQYANDELGSTATPFIPTAGASVTRAADVCSMTGTNFSSWYNQTEGTFLCSYILSGVAANYGVISASDGTLNNRITLRGSNASAQTASIGVDATITQWGITIVGQTANALTSASSCYKVNDVALSRGGSAPTTDTSATIPVVNQLRIGADGDGSLPANGWISRIAYWNRRLPNDYLRALSGS